MAVEVRREIPVAQSAVHRQLFAVSCLLLVVMSTSDSRTCRHQYLLSRNFNDYCCVQSQLLLTGRKELVTLNKFSSCRLTEELQGR